MSLEDDLARMKSSDERCTSTADVPCWCAAADRVALVKMVEYLTDWAMTLVKHPANGMEQDAVEHIEHLWSEAKSR